MIRLDDAALEDIRLAAEATVRRVGVASGRAGRRAEATLALVAEVRRLREVLRAIRAYESSRPEHVASTYTLFTIDEALAERES